MLSQIENDLKVSILRALSFYYEKLDILYKSLFFDIQRIKLIV